MTNNERLNKVLSADAALLKLLGAADAEHAIRAERPALNTTFPHVFYAANESTPVGTFNQGIAACVPETFAVECWHTTTAKRDALRDHLRGLLHGTGHGYGLLGIALQAGGSVIETDADAKLAGWVDFYGVYALDE